MCMYNCKLQPPYQLQFVLGVRQPRLECKKGPVSMCRHGSMWILIHFKPWHKMAAVDSTTNSRTFSTHIHTERSANRWEAYKRMKYTKSFHLRFERLFMGMLIFFSFSHSYPARSFRVKGSPLFHWCYLHWQRMITPKLRKSRNKANSIMIMFLHFLVWHVKATQWHHSEKTIEFPAS